MHVVVLKSTYLYLILYTYYPNQIICIVQRFLIFIQIVDLLVFRLVFLIKLHDIILKLTLSCIILYIVNIIVLQYYLNCII